MEKQKKPEEKAKEDAKEVKKEKKTSKPSDKETIQELTDTLQRLQAEFENYKKRIDKEKTEYKKYVVAEFIKKLLPVLDSFELALKNTTDKEKFMKGVEMIYAQLHGILGAEGLRAIKAVGERFDPYKHEVLLKQGSDKEEDIILEELQKGYSVGDFIIRHSKVKVSEKPKKNEKK